MTNAEARFSNSLRPRKPEGSLGRTAQDVHLDSHTAPELWTRRAQRTSFNTLDNWGHKKLLPNQKRLKDRKGRLKGHRPKHVYNALGYIIIIDAVFVLMLPSVIIFHCECLGY